MFWSHKKVCVRKGIGEEREYEEGVYERVLVERV